MEVVAHFVKIMYDREWESRAELKLRKELLQDFETEDFYDEIRDTAEYRESTNRLKT